MLVASDRFRAALVESHKVACAVEVINAGQPTVWAQVQDGQVTADRTRPIRYSVDLTLSADTDLGKALSPYRTRVRVWRGIDYAGDWTPAGGSDVEMVACGTFRVQDVDVTLPRSLVAVTGLGLESYVRDDHFFTPAFFPGGSALQRLRSFITESVPGTVNIIERVPDTLTAAATWDQDRWDSETAACQMLARSLGAEVYANAYGGFVVRPVPGIADSPTGTTAGGAGGNLRSVQRSYTREAVANLVVARSSATSGADVSGLFAMAWDDDPRSPTFLGTDPFAVPAGSFGRSVLRYASPLLGTYDQCLSAARSVLADNRGLVTKTGVTALADPTTEPGDVRTVQTDLGLERQLIDAFTLPLAPGDMSLTCRSTRITL